ncbi:MAG: DUF2179 domain-containing protein [Planctomycetales bacterium]|nr:DUF2179 domain-containing protein [Planctomycetales bacterium]
MAWLDSWPLLATAALVFSLRIIDVSLGTLRTLSIVQGRAKLSVLLGFVESFVWLTAVSQALRGVNESLLLSVAYCAGFAMGNAVGLMLDRHLAMGVFVVRIIPSRSGAGADIAAALRSAGWRLTTFDGNDGEGPRKMLFVVTSRRDAPRLLDVAREVDPEVYYSFDLLREFGAGDLGPLPRPTGWRGVLQRK